MSGTATIKIPVNTLRPYSRVQHVRENYSEDVALFLLTGTWFRIDRSLPQRGMADWWERQFDAFVDEGYMRRTKTGAYVWQQYVARVQPAGPGRMTWYVYDSVKSDMPLVQSGTVYFPADADQGELDAAGEQAKQAARQAMTELGK